MTDEGRRKKHNGASRFLEIGHVIPGLVLGMSGLPATLGTEALVGAFLSRSLSAQEDGLIQSDGGMVHPDPAPSSLSWLGG